MCKAEIKSFQVLLLEKPKSLKYWMLLIDTTPHQTLVLKVMWFETCEQKGNICGGSIWLQTCMLENFHALCGTESVLAKVRFRFMTRNRTRQRWVETCCEMLDDRPFSPSSFLLFSALKKPLSHTFHLRWRRHITTISWLTSQGHTF